jgi:hypothetical protein
VARPRGEVRIALSATFESLRAMPGEARTWRDMLSIGIVDPRSRAEVAMLRYRLVAESVPVREAGAHAQAGLQLRRRHGHADAVENMARAGAIVRVGSFKAPGSRVALALYAPASAHADLAPPGG